MNEYIFQSNKKEDDTIYLSMFRIRKNYRTISSERMTILNRQLGAYTLKGEYIYKIYSGSIVRTAK